MLYCLDRNLQKKQKMKTKEYIKKRECESINEGNADCVTEKSLIQRLFSRKVLVFSLIGIAVLGALTATVLTKNEPRIISLYGEDGISIANLPMAVAVAKRGVITVPSGQVKANPFLPYRDIGDKPVVNDVPMADLVPPPEASEINPDVARLMDTVVSGILYDKYSPSAILNIEGNDYLVKKGDIVNNYKVVNIMKDSVTVKLGSNVYKAGIGEILTEGELNHTNDPNLSKKFGGEK